jgi:hypothetical protein
VGVKFLLSILIATLFLTGCHPKSFELDPGIIYFPQARQFRILPSDFPTLTQEELRQDWGKELKIAIRFARELDLYRAITSYKRALFLIPQDNTDRLLQIEYSIMLCYYLGQKYESAVDAFEDSHLSKVSTTFPAFRDLVIILYDSYREMEEDEKADAVFNLLEKGAPSSAKDLELYEAIEEADIPLIQCLAEEHPKGLAVENFLNCFCMQSKSVRTAQTLNAVLPGAGYFYVGQKTSALTSFLINTSFIAAAWYFFDHGNYGAGVITTSLEFGWYVGGINGAGLAAKEWNQYVYRNNGKELLIELGLFPVLMIGSSF